jgi:hypothetical protein
MSIITAQCKYPAKAYDTQYGRRVNAVFITPDGQELKVWGNAGYSPLESVVKGQCYQLDFDYMGNAKLVDLPKSESNGCETNGKGNNHNGHANHSRSEEIKDYLGRLGKLMSHTVLVVRRELGETLEPDIEQRYATALFIQTCRKFNL